MSDYDNRQYILMIEQLDQFKLKQIDLKHLINGLESLLGVLTEPDEKWKFDFQRQWGVLEDVYADAIDRGRLELPDAHKELVEQAVQKLEAMIRRVVQPVKDTDE
jgi:hypothetical protein